MKIDALSAARVTLAAVPLYAQGLVGGTRVRVMFDRTAVTARTNGTDIILPALPLPRSAEDVEGALNLATKVQGFIPHEVAHCRFTDFDSIAARFPNGLVSPRDHLVKSLENVIEDARIEKQLIGLYPGTRGQIDDMCELLSKEGWFSPCEQEAEPAKILTSYALYTVRGLIRGQGMFDQLALESRPAVVARFGEGFTTRLDVLLENRAPKCTSTADVLQLADVIVDVLEDEEKKAEEESNASSDDSTGGDSNQAQGDGQQDDGDGDDQAGNGSGGDQTSDGDKADAAGDGAGGAGGDAGDAGDADGIESGTAGTTPSPQDILDAIKSARDGAEMHGEKDLGDVASAAIQAQVDAAVQQALDDEEDSRLEYVRDSDASMKNIDVEGNPNRPRTDGSFDPSQANRLTQRITALMRNELQVLQRERTLETHRSGTLNQRRLSRADSGDRRLFISTTEKKQLNTAVFILEDISGSMKGDRIRLASNACFAGASSMNALKGVTTAVGTFPGYSLALRFGERAQAKKDHFALKDEGSTPMAEGILWAARQLVSRKEDRKILIVATDGEPDCKGSAAAQIAAVEAMGIEVHGLGILHAGVTTLFRKNAVIRSIDELPHAMVSMVRGSIRSQLIAA